MFLSTYSCPLGHFWTISVHTSTIYSTLVLKSFQCNAELLGWVWDLGFCLLIQHVLQRDVCSWLKSWLTLDCWWLLLQGFVKPYLKMHILFWQSSKTWIKEEGWMVQATLGGIPG